METDVVVIGSGSAEMASALTAAERGAKVIVMEKLRNPDGDSYNIYLSGGTLGFAVNSGRIAGENALKYIGK